MKSILENRPALAAEVDKVAEVAGYLWQKGWAERNGGNITVNITEPTPYSSRRSKAVSKVSVDFRSRNRLFIECSLGRISGLFLWRGYGNTGSSRNMREPHTQEGRP